MRTKAKAKAKKHCTTSWYQRAKKENIL